MSSSESGTDDLAAYPDEEVQRDLQWWAAANYLTVGQIYLQANPLLRDEVAAEQIKPRLLGHWGTSPGLSFVYAHVSRLIRHTGQECIYLAGPGHGGPALVAASWLEKIATSDPGYRDLTPHMEPSRADASYH